MANKKAGYSILYAPLYSFFSKGLYRDAALHWKGTCFGYLFLLLASVWIVTLAGCQTKLNKFMKDDVPPVLSQVPDMAIKSGALTVDAPQPLVITIPGEEQPLLVIDTTGEITSLDDTDAYLLVTETHIMYRKNESTTETTKLADFPDMTITQDSATGFLDVARKYMLPIIFPFALVISFISRILQALVAGAIGMVLTAIFRVHLAFVSVLRIAVLALTPCILIQMILTLVGIPIPGVELLCIFIVLFYLTLGVWAASRKDEAPPVPSFENRGDSAQ
jgi:hypothetical protein